ncbi:MAG: SGNH/GDSL hydrolase family protein [Limisphaerales bacterium]
MLKLSVSPLAFAAVLTFSPAARSDDFQIHDGDRVVFLGDSITEQRLYTTYIEGYALSRHPDWKLTFRNVGWGGDTSWLRQRSHPDEAKLFAAAPDAQQKMVEDSVSHGLGRDVLPLKPTFITIKFGMNDFSYQAFRPDIFAAYTRSQTELAKELTTSGARVTFLTPQPIEEKRPDPDKDIRNQSLRKFSDGLKEVAAKTHTAFVDQFDPYMKIMMDARAKDPQAFIGAGDAVHPGPKGHTMMAWAVLKGLGASALVSSADIDASAKKAKVENCKVDHIQMADHTLTFDRLDNALPMPIDKRAQEALTLAPILNDLSRLDLQVTGLPEGTYTVSIDGEDAGKVTSEALAKGWNFSNATSPITKQTADLLDLIFKKNDLYFQKWRNVQLFSLPGWAQGADIEKQRTAEMNRIEAQIAELETRINETRKPKSHHFEIKSVSP